MTWEPTVIDGMGTDAPTTTNDSGGKQSYIAYRFDLLDGKAMFQLAEILSTGATKYGEDNWRSISSRDGLTP